MNRPVDIHTRADQLMRESRGTMNKAEAYQELSRRGRDARAKRRGYSQSGVLHPMRQDRMAFESVEKPTPWWL